MSGKPSSCPASDAFAYFQASQNLRTNNASLRLHAVATLMVLTWCAAVPVRRRARLVLEGELGPYAAAGEGPICVAPEATVQKCDAEDWDCRACKWLWRQQSFV